MAIVIKTKRFIRIYARSVNSYIKIRRSIVAVNTLRFVSSSTSERISVYLSRADAKKKFLSTSSNLNQRENEKSGIMTIIR